HDLHILPALKHRRRHQQTKQRAGFSSTYVVEVDREVTHAVWVAEHGDHPDVAWGVVVPGKVPAHDLLRQPDLRRRRMTALTVFSSVAAGSSQRACAVTPGHR